MGGDALTEEEKREYEDTLAKVDWGLPGMEGIDKRDRDSITRSILSGDIVNSYYCMGWALWPTCNRGYYDERWLRKIADFLEIQNKPFWDEYEEYCKRDA